MAIPDLERYLTLYDNMVHYAPTLRAIPSPPPICPKCGSHRTPVVGLSNAGTTIVLRCSPCGERSEVPIVREERPVAHGAGVEEWQQA